MLSRLFPKEIIFLAALFLLLSCTTAKSKIAGEYNTQKNYLGSKLLIKADKSFYFSNDGVPLVLNGKNFYYSEGNWQKYADTLFLNSSPKPLLNDSISSNKTNTTESSFTFFYRDGDTLAFSGVARNDTVIRMLIHGNYKSLKVPVSQYDTLTFYSYGYSPFKMIISTNSSLNYNIYRQLDFIGNYFNGSKFLIKRNKLIELATNEQYVKKK